MQQQIKIGPQPNPIKPHRFKTIYSCGYTQGLYQRYTRVNPTQGPGYYQLPA